MNVAGTAHGRGGSGTARRSGRVLATRLPGRWTPVLLLVVALLCLQNLVMEFMILVLGVHGLHGLERMLFVNDEANIPTWFNTILLFVGAEQLWQCADAARDAGSRWHRHWRFLSAVFCYLSIDELASLHERAIAPMQRLLGVHSGPLTYAWVVIALPLVAVLGLLYVRFLRALPGPIRNAILLAGVLYVGGAAGLEMVGGAIDAAIGRDSMSFVTESVVEEGLEMVGAIVFAGAVFVARERFRGEARIPGAAREAAVDPAPAPVG